MRLVDGGRYSPVQGLDGGDGISTSHAGVVIHVWLLAGFGHQKEMWFR